MLHPNICLHQVGYSDVMTPGRPQTSSLVRVFYPTVEGAPRPRPLWTDSAPRDSCIQVIQAMFTRWPSWARGGEYLLLPALNKLGLSPTAFSLIFQAGWSVFGEVLSLPLHPEAVPLASPHYEGWPVVLFSHGLGVNRAGMSQLVYQLASQGVVVFALEHREGSACSSFYRETREAELVAIPHRLVGEDDKEVEVRESQAKERTAEVLRCLDLVAKVQAGEAIENVFSLAAPAPAPSALAGLLDLSSLHLMGHSFGGATVLLAATQLASSRKVAGVLALDPWMFPVHRLHLEVDLPIYVMNSEAFLLQENVDQVLRAAGARRAEVEWSVLEGGVHLSATDIPSLFPQWGIRRGLGFMGAISAEAAIAQINTRLWKYLGGKFEKTRAADKNSEKNNVRP